MGQGCSAREQCCRAEFEASTAAARKDGREPSDHSPNREEPTGPDKLAESRPARRNLQAPSVAVLAASCWRQGCDSDQVGHGMQSAGSQGSRPQQSRSIGGPSSRDGPLSESITIYHGAMPDPGGCQWPGWDCGDCTHWTEILDEASCPGPTESMLSCPARPRHALARLCLVRRSASHQA